MGSGASKAAGAASRGSAAAASAARRTYPSRAPGTNPTASSAATTTSADVAAEQLGPRATAANEHSRLAPEDSIGPHVHPQTRASGTRTAAIDLDARDPDFASRLSQLGAVRHPAPTFSSSSTANSQVTQTNQHIGPFPSAGDAVGPGPASNPAIAILTARQRIADAVEAEKQASGRRGFEGRTYADVATLRKALVLRDEQGMFETEIETRLGLKRGAVQALGGVGTVEAV